MTKAWRAGRARARAEPEATPVDGEALRVLLEGVAAEAELVEIPVNRPPWTATTITAGAGDRITWLAWGRLWFLRPLAAGWPPSWVLRARVGAGPLHRSARDTFTFPADRDGPLEIGSVFPGEMSEGGRVSTDRLPYRAMQGGFGAVVVRWAPDADPREALESLAASDPSGLCAAEARRLAAPPGPPPGWSHHHLTGEAEIYAPSGEGIAVDCRETVGIIRRPAEATLTPTLRLRWSWRLDKLPSALPEDTLLTHDYLSVALEFDDGQDLTWHWSSALPPGFSYRCPLEHWRHRETHVVARSGSRDLGRWVDEERPVLADHQVAIGGPAPARVVNAWLISVSVFQRGEGRGEFGRIELVDGDRTTRVL